MIVFANCKRMTARKFKITLFFQCAKAGHTHEMEQLWKECALRNRKEVKFWGAKLNAYSKHKEHRKAIRVFREMEQLGIRQNATTFLVALKAYGALKQRDQVEATFRNITVNHPQFATVRVLNALISAFGACADVASASSMFESVKLKNCADIWSYTAMMTVHMDHKTPSNVLSLYQQVQKSDIALNRSAYLLALRSAAHLKQCDVAHAIQCDIERDDAYRRDLLLQHALITAFGKCRDVKASQSVFDGIAQDQKAVESFNNLMTVYLEHNLSAKALDLYEQLRAQSTIAMDAICFVSALRAAAHAKRRDMVSVIRSDMGDTHLRNVQVATTFIGTLCAFGDVEAAERVFGNVEQRGDLDMVCMNVMMQGMADNGRYHKVMELYALAQTLSLRMDVVSYMVVL